MLRYWRHFCQAIVQKSGGRWSQLWDYSGHRLGFGGTRKVRDLSDELQAGVLALHTLAEDLEHRFSAISRDFQTSSELSQKLVHTGETLVHLAVGRIEGKSDLREVVGDLRKPLEFLVECDERSQELVDRLPDCSNTLDEICRLKPLLQSAVVPLKFIQTLFRVESAVMPPAVCAMFTGLAQDIDHLHGKLSQTLNEQFIQLENARKAIHDLSTRLNGQVKQHKRFVTDHRDKVESSLEELDRMLRASQERDFRFSKTTQGVNNAIGQAIMSLQFQDITRQKLEHVDSAMVSMRERIGKVARGPWKEVCDNMHYLHQTARIQLGQLDAVAADLNSAEEGIRSAMANIQSEASNLDDDCLKLDGLDGNAAAQDGMVQVLLDATSDIRRLMETTVSIQREIQTAVLPINGLMANFTGGLREHARGIRLIALNAQVHAAQIGRGTGLEVLSERTCHISDEANAVNERAASQLQLLSTTLEQISTQCTQLNDQAAGELSKLTTESVRLESRLHEYRDRTIAVFQEVNELAVQLRQHLETASEQISFVEQASTAFGRVVRPLQALVEVTKHFGAGEGRITEQLVHNYTMASERDVHLAALQLLPDARSESVVTEKDVRSNAEPVLSTEGVEMF